MDSENRLKEIKENGSLKSQYKYDGDGGRTKKVIFGNTTNAFSVGKSSYEELYEVTATYYLFFLVYGIRYIP